METQKKLGGWCKATIIFAIISLVFAVLPMASVLFVFLTALNFVIVPIGIICGIVALFKSQSPLYTIIGMVLCAGSLFVPHFLLGL